MEEPKILALSGSPRAEGNSSLILDKFLEGAAVEGVNGEKVIINQLNFKPCQGCGACNKDGICIIKDDMQKIHQMFEEFKGIVLAFPIHFGSMSAQTKMMIDRFQAFWAARYVLKEPRIKKEDAKKGFYTCVKGSNVKRFCKNAGEIVGVFFDILNIQEMGSLSYGEVRTSPGIVENKEALQEVMAAGQKFARELL